MKYNVAAPKTKKTNILIMTYSNTKD
jgi:hypothetical protein